MKSVLLFKVWKIKYVTKTRGPRALTVAMLAANMAKRNIHIWYVTIHHYNKKAKYMYHKNLNTHVHVYGFNKLVIPVI